MFIKKKGVEDFEKIVKSPHFLHLTSINRLVLKIRLCLGSFKKYVHSKLPVSSSFVSDVLLDLVPFAQFKKM